MIALWVSRVDLGAVRNTSDVDLLVRRSDLDAIKLALACAGFEYRHSNGIDMFLDGPHYPLALADRLQALIDTPGGITALMR